MLTHRLNLALAVSTPCNALALHNKNYKPHFIKLTRN